MAETNPFKDPNYGLEPGKASQANPFHDPEYGKESTSDGPFMRGVNQAKNSAQTFANLATGDAAGAAQRVAEGAAYRRENPGTKEGNELMAAWERGDGITGGIKEVAGEFAKDWREAPSIPAAVRATGKNLSAMGGGIVEQIPNMVLPVAGMLAGGAAGGAAGTSAGPVGTVAGTVGGAFAGSAAGNTAMETGEQVLRALNTAGINPEDRQAVQAYLERNGDSVLGTTATKGSIIAAIDTLTMGAGSKLLSGPARAATDRALAGMGVDVADRAAVKAARASPDFAARIAADAEYKAATSGTQKIARNVGTAALEPAGEYAGEYLGQGIATGDWDSKGAALEALSSLGQSTATFAGQKAYQAVTRPATTANQQQPPAAETPPAETPPPAAAPAPVLDEQALERAGVMPPPVLDEQQISRKVDLESGAPIPYTPPPAEELAAMRKAAMGIDPATGPLSAGAAIAIETQAAEDVRLGAASTLADGATSAEQVRAAQEARLAADPGMTFERIGPDASVASGQQAIWRNRDFDLPIEVVDVMSQPGPDGRRYAMVRGAINDREAVSYVPLDEIVPSSLPAASKTTPTPSPQAAPSGSFGAMNDLADLVSQERQDVAQRRAGIADRQGQRREFDLAEADRRTAESMQREAQARRRAVLDAVLADPETTNPAGRFAATLRREGYRDSAPTEDELRTIQRFEDVRAAQPAPLEVEPSAPNELDPAAMGIRERRAPAEKVPLAPPKNLREGLERVRAARAAAAAAPATPAAASPAETWARMDAGQRTALAGRLQGVPPIIAKNVHRADWAKINSALQGKLVEAMASRAAGQEAIDAAAHEAATSPRNDRAQPTEAQAKAGNYKKGHVSVGGLDIAIENPEGSTRSGIDPGGKPWSVTMGAHYGYVKRTQGADGDQVDVYIAKADPVQSPVFVVDQFDNRTGKFDEHKAILGASSLEEARALYDAHFSDGKGAERRGAITPMGFDAFKDWAKSGNTAAPLGQRIAAPIDKKPGAAAVAAGGGQRGESASPAVGRALQILMDRTDGVGAPDGLGGPEHADARTAIVSALTGERAADIEAAPNFKFRTSVPQVERLLYDAAGIPAGKTLNERRAPFMDWLDRQQAGGAAQASPESTARAEALDQEMARKLQEAEGGDTAAEQDAPAGGLRFSRSAGQAGEFVAAPDGSIDFGEITPEMAQAMRRQAGKIRLQHGVQNENGTGWGLAHIEANHGNQIRNAGFTSVEAFVSFVARNFNEVLQATNRQMLVAISGTRQDVMFVQLEPADGGDYYRINTAFPASRDYLAKQQRKGMKVLWDGSEPAPAATGQQPPYAGAPAEESGQGAPIARGQSNPSVANPEAAGSPTAQKSAAPALPRPSITAESLPAIFAERFPKLAGAIKTMLDRGALGQPGGLVVIGNAQEFADHSGRKLDDAVQLFESGDGIHTKGLYDSKTGITYLVGPNLTQDSASAVVLHEMVHGQQRQALDQKALALIEGRAKEAPALRVFLDRVAERMETVGETGNPFEATAYIVEMAAQEGRQSGFSRADGPILAWIEHNIGRKVADMVRDFVATVRAWALAHGVELKAITVDDLVAYAMAGVGKAARGQVVTDGKAGPAPAFSRGSPEGNGVGRVAERLRDTAARAAGRPRPDPNDPFSAENTRLREQDKSLWQKAKGQLRRWLAPGGLLPDSVFAEKIARDSKFQAVEFDIRHIVGGFEQAVKQDFGTPFDKLTQAQQRTLSEALAGKVAGSLPKATKTAVVAMRQYIDSLSGEYLQIIQGRIDALQAKAEQSGRDADKAQAINEIGLYEKIRNNVGAYVHRSYQAFDDPKWFQKVPTATLNAARQYLKDGYMEGGKTGEAEALRLAEVALAEILKNGTAYDSMESFIAEGKLGAKDLSVLMRRKDVPPVIRALLGEYADPRLNFTKSATKMGRLIWNQRFLDRVREMGMGTFLFEGKDRPPSATTQIAAQGSEVYAPLNGLWTFPEVAQSFKDALGKEQMGELYRFIVRANGLVKYGKTVLSPTTAMRNWQSAMFFALANGHFDLTQMKKSVAAFREQVRQNATGDDLAYLRHLKELGVVYDTPYAGEMMRFIEDAKADSGMDTVMRAFGASDGAIAKGLRGVKQINQVAQGFYSFGDDFWKIIGFENEKAGLLKAGLPVAEAEREAAKRIRDTYPTYSMVGAGIQKLSRFPLMGTFVSFPAEIVRTSANMLRMTAADLKSDNPALRALGMKRAVGMAVVSGLFYGLAALSKAGSGVDDDEEEALRDLAPEWQKNSTFLFAGRDEKGQLRYFDMSFLDPYGYWKRPITAMLRDQPWEKSAASAIKDMLTPFFGADIATAAIFQVLANKKDSGGKVYQEGADALDQAGAIANHLRKALQPGFVGNIERLTLAAQGIRREGSGQPYDLNDEMTALLGWRASTMDPKTALYYRSFEFNDAMTEAKQVLTRTLRSVNPVSPEDIRDAREVAQSRQAEAFTEMRRLVQAAQAAGMNPAQIRQVLKQSSISQANAEALLRGTPPRLVLGVPAAAKAVQQARAMEGPEFAQEVAKRYRMASGM
ncbi:hypothetical protein [Zoogloea sp.]|uniref:hypothetical protein n=1 Tax=Zoogloea sp. TaxID=49181 RepID=UPI0025E2C289|nr:hypothetical protein [Zoogloea sp.]MCK6392065.1 hypothetical protein [Zoogloea sp.]